MGNIINPSDKEGGTWLVSSQCTIKKFALLLVSIVRFVSLRMIMYHCTFIQDLFNFGLIGNFVNELNCRWWLQLKWVSRELYSPYLITCLSITIRNTGEEQNDSILQKVRQLTTCTVLDPKIIFFGCRTQAPWTWEPGTGEPIDIGALWHRSLIGIGALWHRPLCPNFGWLSHFWF